MDYASIGKNIREIRTKKGLTQDKLAVMTGLSSAHISNIETSHTKVSLPALVDIANALNSSLDVIARDSLCDHPDDCENSLYYMFNDCNYAEKKIISETVEALKKSLRERNV